eukprot:CAMPEP_0185840840 /NCGR_PEP_ID=MMETSP1353-20130828/16892_1 /TAXON_ID=1077150 /ORGANISM="Erythrolobus australicus, Strain CCMP3124" /LENGTH=125 /DNA_ID=CAMNT_0028540225 /DNA_START=648 /DNA_END=1021 /DNA_ORIENTATION=-
MFALCVATVQPASVLAGHSAYVTVCNAHIPSSSVNTSADAELTLHVSLPSPSATHSHFSQENDELEHNPSPSDSSAVHVCSARLTQEHVCAAASSAIAAQSTATTNTELLPIESCETPFSCRDPS